MAKNTDILIGNDIDLILSGGDLRTGDSTRQNQYLILAANKGEFKETPLIGAGMGDMVGDEDSDNFADRVRNIPNTNRLLHAFREVVAGLKRHSLIPKEKKEAVISILEKETGFIDFVSISSSLLFSMKYETSLEGLKKQTFYNNVRLNDYSPADSYLDGIEVVKGDYKDIFERFKNEKNVLWLVDPPYLSTDCSTYNNLYWKLRDYLDVLRVLRGTSYVYFTSNKSSIVELCEWLGDGRVTANPFIGAEKITVKENMNYNTSYLDIMLYKRKEAV